MFSAREVEPMAIQKVIRSASGIIAVDESVHDHHQLRAAVRARSGIGVDEMPIRLVPLGESPLLARVNTGEVQFFIR